MIEGDVASDERFVCCSDVEEEVDVTDNPLCGNGGLEKAAKLGNATTANLPFRVNAPVAPGRPTEAEACYRPGNKPNPDAIQGYDDAYKRAIESGGRETELMDMNWEDG